MGIKSLRLKTKPLKAGNAMKLLKYTDTNTLNSMKKLKSSTQISSEVTQKTVSMPFGRESEKIDDQTENAMNDSTSAIEINITNSQDKKYNSTSHINDPNSRNIASMSDSAVDASQSSTKSKFQHKSITEDPLRYHARPRDLDSVPLTTSRPKDSKSIVDISQANQSNEQSRQLSSSAKIFSRISFSSLPLDSRLVKHLESTENGFGLASCTFVQSAVIPMLTTKRQNTIIKSQTGSGKTLAYVLPILNDLIQMTPKIDRKDGTRALILAPTRELCTQIANVITKLVQCCVWIVTGCLLGGEKKKSEKARLRKGITILVSTPGRLLDHLNTTESFSLKLLQFVVLDEADRLLDMGFEKTVIEIFRVLHGQSQQETSRALEANGMSLSKRWSIKKSMESKISNHGKDLCHIFASATLTKAVTTQLAGPIMLSSSSTSVVIVDADKQQIKHVGNIKNLSNVISNDTNDISRQRNDSNGLDDEPVDEVDDVPSKRSFEDVNTADDQDDMNNDCNATDGQVAKKSRIVLGKNESIEAPAQLNQYFMMVTCKWRLAALISFLKSHQNQKIIVFFSTCDSVDYHGLLFRETSWPADLDPAIDFSTHSANSMASNGKRIKDNRFKMSSDGDISAGNTLETLPIQFQGLFGSDCDIFRLHGNMSQNLRVQVFESFSKSSQGILLCTDVAARGLDLPQVDWIVQYDPPCETTDYVHRIGRTARQGYGGSAVIFLLPAEINYIYLLQSYSLIVQPLSLVSLFLEISKFIPGSIKFKNIDEMAAIIIQRRIETVLNQKNVLTQASQQAFRSFLRSYATHSMDTKGIFKVSALHLGHVAKSFGLRENPLNIQQQSDDIIGRVMNGEYSVSNLQAKYQEIKENEIKKENLTKEEKKKLRDEKYSLSKNRKLPNNRLNGMKRIEMKSNKNLQQKLNHSIKDPNQKGNMANPSGRFRKTSGYFKKKLRNQSSSEFSQ